MARWKCKWPVPISCYCTQSIYHSTTASIVWGAGKSNRNKANSLTNSIYTVFNVTTVLFSGGPAMLHPRREAWMHQGWYHPSANVNHKLDDSPGGMKTFGRAGKNVLPTANGLQMFHTKKSFWILTTEIEVIFLNVRGKKTQKNPRTHISMSLPGEYDLVSNSLIWKGWSRKSSSEKLCRQILWVRVFGAKGIVSQVERKQSMKEK